MEMLPCLGKVEKGKFIAEDPRAFRSAFFGHEGKRVRVTVERFRNRRSTEQNRYYHGIVVPAIGKAIGEQDMESVHEMLKAEFNYEILVIGNKEMKVPRSTAKLETVAFSEYMEKVRMWAAKFLELYIPDPNEVEK
jgi:hypothetical protein